LNLAEWLFREREKAEEADPQILKESIEMCKIISNSMNDLNQMVSSVPIFQFPEKNPNTSVLENLLKKKKTRKIKIINGGDKSFKCNLCHESFSNGQGLGGHMSRKHPNQSEKFIMKKKTRDRRIHKRMTLYEAKKKLLLTLNEDIDEILNDKVNGKKIIKDLVNENRKEYLVILRDLKKKRNK
jgi:hypothetical protein